MRDGFEAILTRSHSEGTTLSEADYVLGRGSTWTRTFEPIPWRRVPNERCPKANDG
jgi:hypothetical protein